MMLFDFLNRMYSPSKGARNFPSLAFFPVNRVLRFCHAVLSDSRTSSLKSYKEHEVVS
jgi:hypothetical protein